MKHALAVLTGIAVGMPVMAALASASGHTSGGLPDRYVPWARTGHHPQGDLTLRMPGQRRARPESHRGRGAVSPRGTRWEPPEPEPETTMRPAVRHGRDGARHDSDQRAPDLRISIAAPRSARPGGTYTYRVRLANHGPGTSRAITVRSLLPKGVVRTGSALPDGAGGYAGSRDATLVMPRLAPGRSATARFEVRVRPKAHGDLVARTRIAHVGGARGPRPDGYTARVSTRVR